MKILSGVWNPRLRLGLHKHVAPVYSEEGSNQIRNAGFNSNLIASMYGHQKQ